MNIEIKNINYYPSEIEISNYRQQSVIKTRRPADLRFGKIVTMTDEDLDG